MFIKNFVKIFSELVTITNAQIIPRRVSTLSDFEIQHNNPRIIKSFPIPMALYGGRHTVTMIPGGGIGPKHASYVMELFRNVGVPVDFEVIDIDSDRNDNVELEDAITSIKRNGVAIKGQIDTKSKDFSVRLRNLAIRNDLDLFVYLVWCKSYPGVSAKHKDIDVVLVRQNTEGEYTMLEHSVKDSVVESYKIITESNSLKVATFAFEFARKNGRKKVTTVHKANIMKLSDGLFLDVSRRVARNYPDIEHNDIIVDNCCMQLVSKPHHFDVILTPNLYGSIVANVICGISGGPGLVSGRNYGDHYAVFEAATRSRASQVAGENMANPVAMVNAAVDMLHHLGHTRYAQKIEKAVYKTLCENKVHTADVRGTASSDDVINNIINNVLDG